MIEKEKLAVKHQTAPKYGVYRPPAARLAETRRSSDDMKASETKRTRRPDQQMYVPRPKRASYGNELPRSRSHSSSRTSIDSDSTNEKPTTAGNRVPEEGKLFETTQVLQDDRRPLEVSRDDASCSSPLQTNTHKESSCSKEIKELESTVYDQTESLLLKNTPTTELDTDPSERKDETSCLGSNQSSIISVGNESIVPTPLGPTIPENSTKGCEKCLISQSGKSFDSPKANSPSLSKRTEDIKVQNLDECALQEIPKENEILPAETKVSVEAMETISISSDSQSNQTSSSLPTSSSDSKESDSSSEPEVKRKHSKSSRSEKMEIEDTSGNKKKDCESDKREPREKNKKNRRIFPNEPVSDVLIISDTSSSNDSFKMSPESGSKREISNEKKKTQSRHRIQKSMKSDSVDPGDCDWETLYDDSGDCLVPDLMEELTNSVGRVRVASVDNDYRQFQSVEERTNDGECIIEIYDFPAEFKTTDLINIFAAYRSKNFQIKWVDDTHALGVFASPIMADEVLACTLPFVKTRPLRMGIAESRVKARNMVLPPLPPLERPKTCTALARRLVSGALGLRLPTSTQDREKERQVLREAREKRRLEAQQREAAWEGTISSASCI